MGNCQTEQKSDEKQELGTVSNEESFNREFEKEKRNLLMKNEEMQTFIKNSSYIKIDLGKNSFYSGDVHESKANGKGILKTDDYIINSEFVNGRPNGNGWIVYTDKNEFNGNFVNGLYHGKGIYKSNKGYVYEGNFELNRFSGLGKCTWQNGATYDGEFKADRFDGCGTYTYPDQKIFKGHYKNGLKSGEGELIFPDGKSKCTGVWANGKLDKILSLEIEGINLPADLIKIKG